MDRPLDPDEKAHRKHLYDVIKEFGVAMVVTRDVAGLIDVRPMTIARVDPGGLIYLATTTDAAGTPEPLVDPAVTIVLQGKTRYAAVRGHGHLELDRAVIDKLWPVAARLPHGRDDAHWVILVFEPQHGEYWDSSGTTGLKFVFAAIKSYMRGKIPTTDVEQHAEVDIGDGEHE